MMRRSFTDHFSGVAPQYAEHRPTYPAALFDWLAAQCPARDAVWDCGTGSGQAALDLARHFGQVMATDASAAQVMQAPRHARIDYRVAKAEASGLPDASVDLVVVAQALHWFDLAAFYREARRVLRPGGLVAAWCYGVISLEGEEIDALVQLYYHATVGPFWPDERRHVESGYRDLPFPFEHVEVPHFEMEQQWDLEQLLGYLRSWSATARFREANGIDPVSRLAQPLTPLWGGEERTRRICWPLSMLVGRV